MIKRVKHISGIGKFYDYEGKGGTLDWKRNTFISARKNPKSV